MRHRVSAPRLREKPQHARMLKRNLLTSLVLYETMRTTRKQAKVLQPLIDRVVSIARTKDSMNAIRAINRFVTDRNASRKIMEVLRERYAKRHSGLTTIKVVGTRLGDGAQMVDIMLIDAVLPDNAAPAGTPAKTAKKKKSAVTAS